MGALPPVEGEELFDSGGVWRVESAPGGLRLLLCEGRTLGRPGRGRPYQALRLSADLRVGSATLDPASISDPPFVLREPLLELWISFLLMRGRGLLVHGCAVKRRGSVHLFAGASGAGKSTLAGILDRAGVGEILSDDRLVVRFSRRGPEVYGTPWHGTGRFSSPAHGPLAAIRFLRKGPNPRVNALAPGVAAARLFEVCFLAGWPREDLARVLTACARLAGSVPCQVLTFRPDASVLKPLGWTA